MKKLLFTFCLLFYLGVNAQNQAANWYFGNNSGISFNTATNSVTPVNNGQLSTEEGCTSISDLDGNLLFYTDGRTAYNANHTVMQNGSGLKGDDSSTQSALIIPKPQDANIYYIFTVDTPAKDNTDFGFNYYEVNMTLDGGLGGIVNNNGTNLLSNTTEKISAALIDCKSQNIWVLTFGDVNGGENNDTFFAYRVTETGVNTTPVRSTFSIDFIDPRGALKFSPNGKQIASANITDPLLLLDFDLDTGVASNLQIIPQAFTSPSGETQQPYGVEFSSNNELLYVTTYYTTDEALNDPTKQYSGLLQYNLKAENIGASEVVIDQRQTYRGALQLGPNGKIYRAMSDSYNTGSPFLSVINTPNAIGTSCNYTHNSLTLTTGVSRQGLPPFMTSFFNKTIDIIQNDTNSNSISLCDGERYTLQTEDIADSKYEWYKDGVLQSDTNFDFEVTSPGFYEVYVELTQNNCGALQGEANVIYQSIPNAFNSTIYQCSETGKPTGLTTYNLNEANAELTGNLSNRSTTFYLTPTDAVDDKNAVNPNAYNNISNPETLYVRVTNDLTGCINYSELTLETSTTQISDYTVPAVCDEPNSEDGKNTFNLNSLSKDILNGLPSSLSMTYYATKNDALLENNPLSTYENTTPYSQVIYGRAENNNACYGINKITLTVLPLPDIESNATVFYCSNKAPEEMTLNPKLKDTNTGNYSFNWSTTETTQTINVSTLGTYTVTVTNTTTSCSKTQTITVNPLNIAAIETIKLIDGSIDNNQITVVTKENNAYEFALINEDNTQTPFQSSPIFSAIKPGRYTVIVKNECGTAEEAVSVIGFPLYFTPNNDGNNDTWQVYALSEAFQPNPQIFIYDRYGKLLKQLSPSGAGWDGTFNGEPMPETDYWFAVTLQNGKVYRNHFSLKR